MTQLQTGATTEFDLAIVGGGMVGASLALALAQTSLRIAVVEPVLPDGGAAQPSFDDRTSALSNGTRRILETIGAWPAIGPLAAAIAQIQVSDAGRFGAVRLEAAEMGLPALGYTVSNRAIGAGLWQGLRSVSHIELCAPAKVVAVEIGADAVELRLDTGARISTRLAVAADGAHSLLRRAAGIDAEIVDYHQVAIVASLETSQPACGIAFERFTPQGPLALLPRYDGSYTIVWTASTADAPAIQSLDDAAFLALLQQRFGWRAGAFVRTGARGSYPLALSRALHSAGPRIAVVGNAAQALHPVAGQGFNLGLRDAAVLAELVAEAGAAGADVGATAVLENYQRRRKTDRDGMIDFTDGLVRLFALDKPGMPQARSLGLLLFDGAPALKRGLARISWGFGDRAPRLLRGLPLR